MKVEIKLGLLNVPGIKLKDGKIELEQSVGEILDLGMKSIEALEKIQSQEVK